MYIICLRGNMQDLEILYLVEQENKKFKYVIIIHNMQKTVEYFNYILKISVVTNNSRVGRNVHV
jgi:hypothetical protein